MTTVKSFNAYLSFLVHADAKPRAKKYLATFSSLLSIAFPKSERASSIRLK
jgi:hypothetical protein